MHGKVIFRMAKILFGFLRIFLELFITLFLFCCRQWALHNFHVFLFYSSFMFFWRFYCRFTSLILDFGMFGAGIQWHLTVLD